MQTCTKSDVQTKTKNQKKHFGLDEKLKALELSDQVGPSKAAKELGIGFSTITRWRKIREHKGTEALVAKSSRPHHSPKKTSKWIIDKIITIKKDKPEMGTDAMSAHLKRFESIDLSSTTIGKIFKKNNLCDGDAGYAESSYHVKGDKDKKLEKTIEAELQEWERFARPNPNDLWQMDIMSFYIRDQHKVYLISILDDCSRFIVNWGLFREQTAENVLEVLKTALAKHGAPQEVLTDQGAQFKHWKGVTKFEKILKKLKIKHIKARSHHPQTCGKIERFHKTIHRELIDKEFFLSQEQAIERIARFIEHYNYARPHKAHDTFTPSDRYFEVIDAVKKYLEAFKRPKNQEEQEGPMLIGQAPKLYLLGKFLGQDIRLQELAGNLSIYLNNQLWKEINLIAPKHFS
jgi:transposase InsO family protein